MKRPTHVPKSNETKSKATKTKEVAPEKVVKAPSKAKIKADETITKQVATIKNRKVVSELWGDYTKDPSSDARDRLILHYSPLVKFVASRCLRLDVSILI